MSNWRAGWCVGPRYIASVAPFLLLPILQLWPRLGRHPWASALLVGLTIPSVLLNVVSGALYPHYPEQFDNPSVRSGVPAARRRLHAVRARVAARPAGAGGDGAARRSSCWARWRWWRRATIRGRAGPRPTSASRWRSPAVFSCRSPRMAGLRAPTRRARPRWSARSGIPRAAHRFLKVAAEHDKRERSPERRRPPHGHQRRPSYLQRARQPDPPLRRDRRGAAGDGEDVRDHRHRRRQPGWQRGADPAGGGDARPT